MKRFLKHYSEHGLQTIAAKLADVGHSTVKSWVRQSTDDPGNPEWQVSWPDGEPLAPFAEVMALAGEMAADKFELQLMQRVEKGSGRDLVGKDGKPTGERAYHDEVVREIFLLKKLRPTFRDGPAAQVNIQNNTAIVNALPSPERLAQQLERYLENQQAQRKSVGSGQSEGAARARDLLPAATKGAPALPEAPLEPASRGSESPAKSPIIPASVESPAGRDPSAPATNPETRAAGRAKPTPKVSLVSGRDPARRPQAPSMHDRIMHELNAPETEADLPDPGDDQ
jgi:hypothetical protein